MMTFIVTLQKFKDVFKPKFYNLLTNFMTFNQFLQKFQKFYAILSRLYKFYQSSTISSTRTSIFQNSSYILTISTIALYFHHLNSVWFHIYNLTGLFSRNRNIRQISSTSLERYIQPHSPTPSPVLFLPKFSEVWFELIEIFDIWPLLLINCLRCADSWNDNS